MKRVIAIACVLLAAVALVVFAAAGGDDDGTYRVRAIFMNAFSVIPGEDVKIAGVKVGKIESLDVTPDHKAAVVLRIDRAGFDDFRKDAECTIRPQSLIGEKFVECTPTQPRPEGAQPAAALPKIEHGAGKGQHLLPVSQTSKPVDLDLVANTLRLPYRERLAVIINELGTGLAGRGGDLRQAIRNADPALKDTDKVLKILADQNRALARLARDGDRILTPLARDRSQVADFVSHANTTAQATAERSTALEQNIAKLPAFLRELRPTMQHLGGLAGQATPVLADLGAEAPAINTFVAELGPFSKAGIPAFQSLGNAADVGRPALVAAKPITQDLRAFAAGAKPLSNNLAALTSSLKSSGGIERFMDYIFFQVAAINGYDSVGHYLRAGLLLNQCSSYAITFSASCTSKFGSSEATAASARAASAKNYVDDPRRSDSLRALDAYFHGVKLDVPGEQPAAAPRQTPAPATPSGSAPPTAPAPPSETASSGAPQTALLDYLLGGGG
jgi:virulence factor Mce-like protein